VAGLPYCVRMTLVWVVLGVVLVMILAPLIVVGVRDRRRVSSADDSAAARTAGAAAERAAADRAVSQGIVQAKDITTNH
jgi:hypothetical protein